MEQVEQGRGLEHLAPMVHSRLGWVLLPQMWEFAPHTVVLANPWPEPAAVAQAMLTKLLLQTRTPF